MLEWSSQQVAAIDGVRRWLDDPRDKDRFYLAGYAGTGKTTIACELAGERRVVFGAYTGKAASRMRQAGCRGATTIHQLMYRNAGRGPDGELQFDFSPKPELTQADVVVIDECSMVEERMGRDLLSIGIPVLVLGDPAQLPPTKGDGFFTAGQPDVMLTEVHRQAESSPILQLATYVRAGGDITSLAGRGQPGCRVDHRARPQDVTTHQVIVGTNKLRAAVNSYARQRLGRKTWVPETGDRVVSKHNDHGIGVLNGETWIVSKAPPYDQAVEEAEEFGYFDVTVVSEDDDTRSQCVAAHAGPFRGETVADTEKRHAMAFEYSYAMTAHTAQGSGWEKVLVFDQSWIGNIKGKKDARRWLYTAITRASHELIVTWPQSE